MFIRSGNSHLLGYSSQYGVQLTVMLADIMAQLTVLTQTISEVSKDQQVDHKRWPS